MPWQAHKRNNRRNLARLGDAPCRNPGSLNGPSRLFDRNRLNYDFGPAKKHIALTKGLRTELALDDHREFNKVGGAHAAAISFMNQPDKNISFRLSEEDGTNAEVSIIISEDRLCRTGIPRDQDRDVSRKPRHVSRWRAVPPRRPFPDGRQTLKAFAQSFRHHMGHGFSSFLGYRCGETVRFWIFDIQRSHRRPFCKYAGFLPFYPTGI